MILTISKSENKRNETPKQKAFKNQQKLLKRQAKAAEVRAATQFLAAKNNGGLVLMALQFFIPMRKKQQNY